MIQTHPVSANRIAEARNRAQQFDAAEGIAESASYALIRERLRVITAPGERDLHAALREGDASDKRLRRWARNTARRSR